MKTKSVVAGIIIAAAFVSPFAASALSIDDLQQQIKNLLSQIATLQVQIKAQRTAASTPAVEAQKMPRICAIINRNLSRGQSGDDVRGLQEFLAGEGFLSASATGFFGPATAQAVAKWQAKNNISALGSFGPMSRDRLKVWCGTGGANGNGLLSVTPQSGPSPLTVTVTSTTGDASDYQPSMADGRDTMIDFGDGSARQWVHCTSTTQDNAPARCTTPVTFTHTYQQDGTYAVSLLKSGGMCIGGCSDETLATQKVVVGSVTTSTGNLSADPQSGSAPLTVTFSTSVSINDAAPTIDFGDGNSSTMTKGSCTAIIGGQGGIRCAMTATHTYTQNGTYTARVGSDKATTVTVGTSSTGSLTADPQSGAAPLPVTFTYRPTAENGQYWIEFGDGEGQIMTLHPIQCFRAPCISPVGADHTYKTAGTYNVSVSTYISCMHTNPRCMIATVPLAQTTVTVSGSNSDETFTAVPTEGAAPLPVLFTARVTLLDPTKVADGNSYKIVYGDGNEYVFTCSATDGTGSCPGAHTATHTYAAGTYTAQLVSFGGFCGGCSNVVGSVTIHSGTASGGGAPVISSFSGPTSLAVNQIGTWKITASDPENGSLKYSILWGDEWTASDASNRAMAPSASVQQDSSFTHSYANAGNYTVALTVTDDSGKQARSTATVQVSQSACTTEYAPVCARPAGCANTCAAGSYCTLQCQLYTPQTYSNRCMMNNANAQFMHDGVCTGNEGYLY